MLLSQHIVPVRCPVTQQRIQQACRGRNCKHPAAFCVAALPSIRDRTKLECSYTCPICDRPINANDVCVDGRLTAFLSEHLEAENLLVRERTNSSWAYHVGPRTVARSRCSSQASATQTPCAVDGIDPSSAGSIRRRSHSDVVNSTVEARNGSAISARALSVHRADVRAVSSAKVARSLTGQTIGNLPVSVPVSAKQIRRREQKESKARRTLMQAVHAELIKRALWEDHPHSRGDSLW